MKATLEGLNLHRHWSEEAVGWNKGSKLSEPLVGSLGCCCPGQGDKEAEQCYPDFRHSCINNPGELPGSWR